MSGAQVATRMSRKPASPPASSIPTPLGGLLRRACACGGSAGPDDKCQACQRKETVVQRLAASTSGGPTMAPPIVHDVLRSPGQPLDLETRAILEPHFGADLGRESPRPGGLPQGASGLAIGPPGDRHEGEADRQANRVIAASGEGTRHASARAGFDFSRVRIHTDSLASESARAVRAAAYTVGHHVVFGGGRYAPDRPEGRRLLAHELTHVVQQRGAAAIPTVQRGLLDDAEKAAEAFAAQRLTKLAASPVGPPSGFTNPSCPTNFCQPFASKVSAALDLAWAGPLILAGIAKKVNSRVVPLWASYLSGGSSPQNLTGTFGKDFTDSPTTATATDFLVGEIQKDVQANQAALLGGATSATVDFTPRLSSSITAIDTPGDPNSMDFNVIGDIAGNIAGGIGKDELAFPIGATPSPFNDARQASVSATLASNPDGSVTVSPSITFTVFDTIDLCPGNCGAPAEQVATIPLSRFEATGLAGDVPFSIQFPAPPSHLAPFVVAAPSPPAAPTGPITGTVTASALQIRSSASTSAPVIGSYPKGTVITIVCQTPGTPVDGNSTWDETDKGFVSDRFVLLAGPTAPPSC